MQVTLYDADGAKIKLIDRDEAAFETVELLCPYLIQNSSLTGEVSHVEDSIVFIQPADCYESIQYLLTSLFETYNDTTLENLLVPVDGFVYAVRGTDTNWYRGRVVSLDEKHATVNYLDYGNSEAVDISELRELTREFMELVIMCVPVRTFLKQIDHFN